MKGHNMTEVDSKQKCISCKFFITGGILGECHRFPQSISKHENDWCGEYSKNHNYVATIIPIVNIFDDERAGIVQGTIEPAKKRGRPARAA